MENPVFDLPPYTIGPYTLRVTPSKKSDFADKRRVVEHDWTEGLTRIAQHLSTRRALECLMRSLVQAMHYRSGLDDRSSEESFTHSLSTGFVELAQNNPRFWFELNTILEAEYAPECGWGRVAGGNSVDDHRDLPEQIEYDGQVCTIEWLHGADWKWPDAYGYYWIKQNRIQLNGSLHGNNLAIVSLHECLHFIHERLSLKDTTKEVLFRRTQAAFMPRFIQQNPKFWLWWLQAVHFGTIDAWRRAA